MSRDKKRGRAAIVIAATLVAFVALPGLLLAYSLIGGSLGIATNGLGWQRDVRVFNNSLDATANNNVAPEAAHPGALGAPLAIWKAARAWASDNPLAAQNFDYDWQGVITTAPTPDANVVSWDATACTGGVLAYTITPIDDGWNIVMCDNWTWADGPSNPSGGQIDIQGVAAHELGHALGLGHSSTSCGSCSVSATMCPSICGSGVSERTIVADDAAGLAAIYGTLPPGKPLITSLSGSFTTFQTLVINGSNFGTTVNVKFTALTSGDLGTIPGVVYGLATANGGTQVSVPIPQAANDGIVIVWNAAGQLISNAFPIDVNYIPPPPPPVPQITTLAPSSVMAFQGGVVTLTGTAFTGATQVAVGGMVLSPPFGFAVVSDTTLTFGAPTPLVLGAAPVVVTTPGGVSAPATLTFVETIPPKVTCPQLAVANTTFTWSYGAGTNDIVVLLAATDPTTFDFGTPYQILLNFVIVGQAAASPLGLGSIPLLFPPGLTGVVFYSQIVSVDEITSAISASNITTTTVLF